jgi:hypothetical protein
MPREILIQKLHVVKENVNIIFMGKNGAHFVDDGYMEY